jgi:hypothetical protein
MPLGRILSLHPVIEEEMTLEVGGHRLIVFADCCPHAVHVGRTYPLTLRATLLEDQCGVPSPVGVEAIDHVGNGRYRLRGFVRDGVLSTCGLELVVEWLPPLCPRDASWVEFEADRISVDVGAEELG